jgi:hypothetical protein
MILPSPPRPTDEILEHAVQAGKSLRMDALLFLAEQRPDWDLIKRLAGSELKVVVAADERETVDRAAAEGFGAILLSMPEAPVHDRLTQALLSAVATEQLIEGAEVIAVYSGFEAGKIDSLSTWED